jgi:hypothetical protein
VYTFQLTIDAVVFCLSFVYSPLNNIRRGLVYFHITSYRSLTFLLNNIRRGLVCFHITSYRSLTFLLNNIRRGLVCFLTLSVVVASLSYSITLDEDLCFFTAFEPTNEERLGTTLFKPNTYLTIATHNTSERKRPCAPSGAFV